MNTFKELFCAEQGGDVIRFRQSLLRACLPLRARVLAPLLGGLNGKFFEADRELIASVGDATVMTSVHEEVRDFFMHPSNTRWLRRILGVRISTTRLKSIARRDLKNARLHTDAAVPIPRASVGSTAASGA